MKTILTLLFIIAIAFTGCKQNSTSPTETKEIIPLKVGNNWILKRTTYDSNKVVTKIVFDTIIILKDTVVKGQTAYIMTETASSIKRLVVMNKSDGFHLLDIRPDTIYYWLAYKYPAAVGDVFSGLANNISVKSINSSITVKAGIFTCYEYFNESQFPDVYYKYQNYLTPGIGRIYAENYTQEKGGKLYMDTKTELQSYDLK
jgi:hypothetical protein